MGSDLRYAVRNLRRNPGFAFVALLTLALGIGGNTAIFSVFSSVLLRPLPYPQADRLVSIREVVPAWARFGPTLPVSAGHFREWRRQSRAIEQAALVSQQLFTLTGEGDPVRVSALRSSASLFPLLGAVPMLGRTFTADEERPGEDQVAILSHRLWANRFHSEPSIIGRKIVLNGAPYPVVGVLAEGANTFYEADVFIPFAIRDSEVAVMGEFNYTCVARLKSGVSIQQAVTDLDAIESGIVKDLPEKVELRSAVLPLREEIAGSSRQSLSVLLAASGVVLLIVVVNLANLLLARASARRREWAIRTAVGADLSRLLRQLLTESTLLAAIGGAFGVLLARWALEAIILKAPLDVPGLQEVRLDWRALAFAIFVTLASGTLFGMIPAWRMTRTDPQDALRAGGRTTESRAGGRMRRFLIGAEVALSVVCLVAGGLLLTSFVRLIRVDKGFESGRAISMGISLPAVRYPDAGHRTRFLDTLLEQVRVLPGVVAAGISNRAPLSGEGSNIGLAADGVDLPASQRPIVDYRCVSPGYFRAMGIPVLSGSLMNESERSRPAAVISALAARRIWPGQDPLGKRFRLGSVEGPLEVIGVVGDIRTSLQKEPRMTVYVPYWRLSRNDFALVVRTAMDPAGIASPARAVIRALDPQLVLPRARSLGQIVDSAVAARRFQLELILLFAAAALLLAAVGVYGVVAQSVAQRTNEIGIRMALGATRGEVGRLVGMQGLTPVIVGLAAGLAASIPATRLVNSLLFQVPAADPLTFGGAAAVLLVSAILACAVPVFRATRVDPLIALRYE